MAENDVVVETAYYLPPLSDDEGERSVIAIERSKTDVTAIPVGASLICQADWDALVGAAGGEETMLAAYKVAKVEPLTPVKGR